MFYKINFLNKLLSSCEKILYGSLNLKLPNGNTYNFNGSFSGPTADLKIKDNIVISHLLAKGDIGFGEDYMNDLWETSDLPSLLTFAALNEEVFTNYLHGNIFYKCFYFLKQKLRINTRSGSNLNIDKHYNLSNKFYQLWLDKSMTYSGALFKNDNSISLESAQITKYNRIFNKLNIQANDNVLDIGCGWGALAQYLANKEVNVVAITLSKNQAEYADFCINAEKLNDKVRIKLSDYRDITGIYDHIISIGMFEHVGIEYWKTYFKIIATHLRKGGKALIQTIVSDEKFFQLKHHNVTNFLKDYIFPGSFLPSHASFIKAAQDCGLKCIESFPFGTDYAITLKYWLTKFENKLEEIKDLGFDEKFIRCWRFYLSYSMAGFISKRMNLVQFTLEHS